MICDMQVRVVIQLLLLVLAVATLVIARAELLYVYEVAIANPHNTTLSNVTLDIYVDAREILGKVQLDLLARGLNILVLDESGRQVPFYLAAPATIKHVYTSASPHGEVIVYGVFHGKLLLMKTFMQPSELGYIDLRTGRYRVIYFDYARRFTAWRAVYIPWLDEVVLVGQMADTQGILRSTLFIIRFTGSVPQLEMVMNNETGDCNEFIGVDVWCPNSTCYLVVGERIHGGDTAGSAYPHGGGVWLIPLSQLENVSAWRRIWQHPRELEIRVVEAVGPHLYVLAEGARQWCPGCVELWRWDEAASNFTLVLNLTDKAIAFDDFPAWLTEGPDGKLYLAVSEKDYHVHVYVIDPATGRVLDEQVLDIPASGRLKLLAVDWLNHTLLIVGARNALYIYIPGVGLWHIGDVAGTVDFNKYCFVNSTLYFSAVWCGCEARRTSYIYAQIYRLDLGVLRLVVKPEILRPGLNKLYVAVYDQAIETPARNRTLVYLAALDFDKHFDIYSIFRFADLSPALYGHWLPYNTTEYFITSGVLGLRAVLNTTDTIKTLLLPLPNCTWPYWCAVSIRFRVIGGFDHALDIAVLENKSGGYVYARAVMNLYSSLVEIPTQRLYSVYDLSLVYDNRYWLTWTVMYTFSTRPRPVIMSLYIPYSLYNITSRGPEWTYMPQKLVLVIGQGRGAATGLSVERADIDYVHIWRTVIPPPRQVAAHLVKPQINVTKHGKLVRAAAVGDTLRVTLPLHGTLLVYLDGHLVKTLVGKTFMLTFNRSGVYILQAVLPHANMSITVNVTYPLLVVDIVDLENKSITTSIADILPVVDIVGTKLEVITAQRSVRLAADNYTVYVKVNNTVVCSGHAVLDSLHLVEKVRLRCTMVALRDYRDYERLIYFRYDTPAEVSYSSVLRGAHNIQASETWHIQATHCLYE